MSTLLDSNVVIALLRLEHVHRAAAVAWFTHLTGGLATCPITQGAHIRLALQRRESVDAAQRSLASPTGHQRHEFWPDDVGYDRVPLSGVIGHRQVTDAYLAELARRHGGGSRPWTRVWPRCAVTWWT